MNDVAGSRTTIDGVMLCRSQVWTTSSLGVPSLVHFMAPYLFQDCTWSGTVPDQITGPASRSAAKAGLRPVAPGSSIHLQSNNGISSTRSAAKKRHTRFPCYTPDTTQQPSRRVLLGCSRTDQMSPTSEFYTSSMHRRHWLVNTIKEGLDLDEVGYTKLYIEFEGALSQRGLLGKCLNTKMNKAQLRDLFNKFHREHSSMLARVPEEWRERCMLAIAHKCNNNERRRSSMSRG